MIGTSLGPYKIIKQRLGRKVAIKVRTVADPPELKVLNAGARRTHRRGGT